MDDEPLLEADQSERLLVILGQLAPNRVLNASLAYSITISQVRVLLAESHPYLRPAQLATRLARAVGSREAHEAFSDLCGSDSAWRQKLRRHILGFVLVDNWRVEMSMTGD